MRSGFDGGGKTYMCIDLKSFYASVECADRGLDPFKANLVVADTTRSKNTICLAITPAMKALGVKNRCRVRDIPEGIDYIAAMPRMRRYMEASGQIVAAYLGYVCAEDVHVYSIDEAFIDATPYLKLYRVDARQFARVLMDAAFRATGVTATAGIGPNMLMAKVALDVCAKHASDGIGMLDAESWRREIWFHQPITDIWGVGPGTARRLAKHGVHDLAGVCGMPKEALRREFGINGMHLLDHAWGLEPCTIAQARSYRPRGKSLSNGQVLMRDYSFEEVKTLVREMALQSCLELEEKGLAAQTAGLFAGYSSSCLSKEARGAFCSCGGLGAGGTAKLARPTNSAREITDMLLAVLEARVERELPIRRITIALGGLTEAKSVQLSLFGDEPGQAKERAASRAMVDIRRRFGANAMLKGASLRAEGNARERNIQIGGHRA